MMLRQLCRFCGNDKFWSSGGILSELKTKCKYCGSMPRLPTQRTKLKECQS